MGIILFIYCQEIIYIPPHTPILKAQNIVKEKKIEPFPYAFLLYVFLTGSRKKILSGEYEVLSFSSTMRNIVRGKRFVRKITIPEGVTSNDVVELLNKAEHLEKNIDAIPEEGSLFPSTYHYLRGESKQKIIDRMQVEMQKRLCGVWAKRPYNLSLKNSEEVLILASIIEKETNLDSERHKVARVFLNRLEKKMPLQADPTIVYALKKRNISRQDLKIKSPYNTYMNKGLPPKPICCPGQASLDAVVTNWRDQNLYFVVTGYGGHNFSETLKEHIINIKKWKEQ